MSNIASPSAADAALDPSLMAPAVPAESAELWQTAILAIGRRVAAVAGSTDRLASDASAALAESLDFDFCGVAESTAAGEMSLTLSAVKFGVAVPSEPLPLPAPPEESLVGFARASGTLVATPDIREEARYCDLILRRCQAQSGLACPLRSNGVSYGSILLASLTPKQISASELVLVETISHLVAAALARGRTEQLLDRSQISAEVLDAVETSVVMLDAERRLLQINRSCEELTGLAPAEVQRRPFCSAFVPRGEEDNVNRIFDQLLSDGQPRQFETRFQRKHGDERRMEWRFRRLDGNRSGALVGTGVDVTAKCELEARLARLQQAVVAPGQPDAAQSLVVGDKAHEFGGGANRRRAPRHPYPYVQRMAPIRNGEMPGIGEFGEILCCDISADGFSFYADAKPIETAILVAFGANGKETFMTARVEHVQPTMHDGKQRFMVGCQFTGRHRCVGPAILEGTSEVEGFRLERQV